MLSARERKLRQIMRQLGIGKVVRKPARKVVRKRKTTVRKTTRRRVVKKPFKRYPWKNCIADQMKRYRNADTAKRICGFIRSRSRRFRPRFGMAAPFPIQPVSMYNSWGTNGEIAGPNYRAVSKGGNTWPTFASTKWLPSSFGFSVPVQAKQGFKPATAWRLSETR